MSFIPVELIKKKRDGKILSEDEIRFLFNGYLAGEIPDYQMSAWLMSVFFKGMTPEETAALTGTMLRSGEVLDFSQIPQAKVDKHSTGGVGDKTSLLLAPIVACAGVTVPMISGRGLGHTGGTLDKLESIPGFSTQIALDRFTRILKSLGTAMIGQTKEICPADKRLYALRDVTGTVESLPLICSSIMSKKLAEGIDALVLDVKCGSGAFMKTLEDARELARSLVDIGRHHGKKVAALITSMDQPLGRLVGNALEVEECLALMKGEALGDYALDDLEDTRTLSLQLAGHMIWLGGKAGSANEGYDLAEKILASGRVYDKFEALCRAQGGDLAKLPKARYRREVFAKQEGFVSRYSTEDIGMAALVLGAGRKTQSDVIDPVAGLQLHKKIGDPVKAGERLFTLFASHENLFDEVERRLLRSIDFSLQKPQTPSLMIESIYS